MSRRALVWLACIVAAVVFVSAVVALLLGVAPWHAPTDDGYWGGIAYHCPGRC